MRASLTEEVAKGPVVTSRQEVQQLLKFELGSRNRERIIAVYVDTKMHVLRIERVAEGTPTGCEVPVTRILHVGHDVGAAGIVIVHNHPSGDASQSSSDRRSMGRLKCIASELDMHLVDAWVVAGGAIRSIFE
jgi:DNA repair protein RadC